MIGAAADMAAFGSTDKRLGRFGFCTKLYLAASVLHCLADAHSFHSHANCCKHLAAGKNPPGKLNPKTLHAQTLRATRTQDANMPITHEPCHFLVPLRGNLTEHSSFHHRPISGLRSRILFKSAGFTHRTLQYRAGHTNRRPQTPQKKLEGCALEALHRLQSTLLLSSLCSRGLLGLLVSGFCETFLALGFASPAFSSLGLLPETSLEKHLAKPRPASSDHHRPSR